VINVGGIVADLIDLQPSTVFAGDFRVLKPLSQGGMGAVYVVEQISTGKQRALKLMLPQLVTDPSLAYARPEISRERDEQN
jgi:serine/threonine protein kinase